MDGYVSISVTRDTYQKLQTLANRLKQPKLRVVDMALNKFVDADEEKAERFYKKWREMMQDIKLPKKIRSEELKIEDAYL
jgi:predicted transcriptional regulator